MHKIFILIISLCCSVSILAQNLKLSGSVKDADTGQVLPGATILVEGSSNGTTTDFDGNFNIAVGLGETLIISYVGFKTQSRVVDNNIDLNIFLEPSNELDEVVVVGYGTQKRSNLGSVSTIEVDKASQTPTTNVTELLRVELAGVKLI